MLVPEVDEVWTFFLSLFCVFVIISKFQSLSG